MVRAHMQPHQARFLFVIFVIVLGTSVQGLRAQSAGLSLNQTAEYDIGFDCPVTSALDRTGLTVWVLLDNCGGSKYNLQAYNVTDGTPQSIDDYTEALKILVGDSNFIDAFSTPMGFTPAGDLSIHYTNFETAETSTLLIPLASGGEATTETSASYNDLLADYSEYPDYSVYSLDHTRVVAIGATSFHVLDIQTATEIVEIPVEGGTDLAAAAFSADGQRLEVVHYNSLDDPNDHSVILQIYRLPTGELLQEYPLPSSPVWISPDGAYAAVNLWSNNIGDINELVVVDLPTGLVSPALSLNDAPAPVKSCLNTGNDMSDVDFIASGRFSFPTMHWLADSSSLIIPLSYGGESAGGGSLPCIFNYSRLRTYKVEKSG